jgi:hypothetical protein
MIFEDPLIHSRGRCDICRTRAHVTELTAVPHLTRRSTRWLSICMPNVIRRVVSAPARLEALAGRVEV